MNILNRLVCVLLDHELVLRRSEFGDSARCRRCGKVLPLYQPHHSGPDQASWRKGRGEQ